MDFVMLNQGMKKRLGECPRAVFEQEITLEYRSREVDSAYCPLPAKFYGFPVPVDFPRRGDARRAFMRRERDFRAVRTLAAPRLFFRFQEMKSAISLFLEVRKSTARCEPMTSRRGCPLFFSLPQNSYSSRGQKHPSFYVVVISGRQCGERPFSRDS